MLIHLLRHAEAETLSPTGADEDRRLTAAGLKRMKAVARGIARLAPGYDAVLVSPLVRARQTAGPVLAACRFEGEPMETRALIPGAEPEAVLHELASLRVTSALLVGHEPHLGRLFGRLLSGGDALKVPMKKASLASFETGADPSVGAAELRLYLPAKILEELA